MGVPLEADRVPTRAELEEAKRVISRLLYDAALVAHRRQAAAVDRSSARIDPRRKEVKRAATCPRPAPGEAP